MVKVEFEQISREGRKTIVERQEENYPVVIEFSQKYVGVEENGEYRLFETGVVKSIHNESGTVTDASEIRQIDVKHSPDAIDVFADEYAVVHGDFENQRSSFY